MATTAPVLTFLACNKKKHLWNYSNLNVYTYINVVTPAYFIIIHSIDKTAMIGSHKFIHTDLRNYIDVM